MFSGTQEKCATCGKTAYPLEKVGFKNLWNKLVDDIHYKVTKCLLQFGYMDAHALSKEICYYSYLDHVDY